jgi:antitoxin component of MazEF toxin-antitoxin module
MGKVTSRNFLQIIQIGNSNGIIIPKSMLDSIGVEKRSYVMVTIEKLKHNELTERLLELKTKGV